MSILVMHHCPTTPVESAKMVESGTLLQYKKTFGSVAASVQNNIISAATLELLGVKLQLWLAFLNEHHHH